MAIRKIWITSLILFFCIALSSCKQPKQSYRTTSYVESQLFFISSPTGGYLKKLFVQEGQTLSKEDKIVTLEGQKTVTAPASSTVIDVLYQRDEYVPPNSPIVSLSLPAQMRIIFYVPENQLDKLSLGKNVSVLYRNKKYPVKITSISNRAEYTPDALFSEKNRYKLVFKIKANLSSSPLKNLLKIGQPVDVDYE
ncbi:MAG: HlyD family efflux transporter periplasmic adaptor subunit [Legionella sp.]|nr:MAG: HlyD family efflux transporter periplasmic adaptor subunit [Legionella sp.]